MGFTLPNYPDAAFPEQAEPDKVDFDILVAADAGIGVTSGCAVTAQGSPDMTVAVASGTVSFSGPNIVVSSGNVTITAANPSNRRFDLVVVNSSGVKSVLAGTPAVVPVFPQPWVSSPGDRVVLAAVRVPASGTVIDSAQIVDKRVTVQPPPTSSGWTTLSKATDESTTADTTLSNDSTLLFTMAANTKYRIRLTAYIESPTAADFKWDFSGPASPSVVTVFWGFGVATGTPTWDRAEAAYPADSIDLVAGTAAVLFLEMIVHNGANSGALNFRWAQQTSNGGSTIVRAGSYLEYAVA